LRSLPSSINEEIVPTVTAAIAAIAAPRRGAPYDFDELVLFLHCSNSSVVPCRKRTTGSVAGRDRGRQDSASARGIGSTRLPDLPHRHEVVPIHSHAERHHHPPLSVPELSSDPHHHLQGPGHRGSPGQAFSATPQTRGVRPRAMETGIEVASARVLRVLVARKFRDSAFPSRANLV
jgi:hypothetical protein